MTSTRSVASTTTGSEREASAAAPPLDGAATPASGSIRMSGATFVMHARWFARPSIRTRQSKQIPIPQKIPRGSPWSSVRSVRMPAAVSAAATVSPSKAATGRPPKEISTGRRGGRIRPIAGVRASSAIRPGRDARAPGSTSVHQQQFPLTPGEPIPRRDFGVISTTRAPNRSDFESMFRLGGNCWCISRCRRAAAPRRWRRRCGRCGS